MQCLSSRKWNGKRARERKNSAHGCKVHCRRCRGCPACTCLRTKQHANAGSIEVLKLPHTVWASVKACSRARTANKERARWQRRRSMRANEGGNRIAHCASVEAPVASVVDSEGHCVPGGVGVVEPAAVCRQIEGTRNQGTMTRQPRSTLNSPSELERARNQQANQAGIYRRKRQQHARTTRQNGGNSRQK